MSVLLEAVGVDAQLAGAGAGVGEGGLGRLLHHVAQLAGQQERALAFHQAHFDADGVAAHGCPGHAGGHADLVLLLGHAVVEAGRAQVGFEVALMHHAGANARAFLPFVSSTANSSRGPYRRRRSLR